MICSKDPLFPLPVLVELCPFLQEWPFSFFFFLFYYAFFFFNVATFILLSYGSDSNCFLFPLEVHTRTGPNKGNQIRSITHSCFLLLFLFSLCPFRASKGLGGFFCSGSSLSLTPVLQLPLLFCGKTTGICFPV